MCIQFLLQDVGVAALAVQDWCSQPWSIAALQALPAHRSQRGRQNRQSPRSPLGRKAASRERERERSKPRRESTLLILAPVSSKSSWVRDSTAGTGWSSCFWEEGSRRSCTILCLLKQFQDDFFYILVYLLGLRFKKAWLSSWFLTSWMEQQQEHKSGDGKRRQTRSRRVRSRGFDHTAVSAVILQANISEQCHCRCQVGDDHLPGGFSASTTRERLVGTAVKFRRRRSASRKAQLT